MTAEITAREQARIQQTRASDPSVSAWVSASAGSGKTKVLTDRVLRLLLQEGQAARRILCLTFTRAAAAEMQTRLARRLGEWAVAEEERLAADLAALGCAADPATLHRARGLFAEVLELPGGMRISTIHSFCQSLLGAFPLEAGLPPQFRVLEEADAAALLSDAREAVLGGASAPHRHLALLAGLVGAEDFSKSVKALLGRRDRLSACLRHGNGTEGLRLRLAEMLELGEGEDEAAVMRAACRVPDAVAQAAAALVSHKNKTPRELAARMREWLARHPEDRATAWAEWQSIFLTGEGALRKALAEERALASEAERILAVQGRLSACRLLEATNALLALAGPVLDHYEARKRSSGLLAYDDLIAISSRVLRDPGSAWVLFKLDGGLDHVLLDEAQDTNPAQWEIASALTEEFFAGFGAELAGGTGIRTIFAVGDTKQSIYGFQGADARGFGTWEARFRKRVEGGGRKGDFRKVELNVSFRSTAPVLALVDAVFADGPARAGVVEEGIALAHRADREGHAGEVELWPLLRAAERPKPEPWLIPETPERVADANALMAEALAARIAHMVRHETLPARCLRGPDGARRARPVRPGDVLVLVRRLANVPLVPLLVRALKERGVPVAGVSRLALVEHIAVMDLLALCEALLLPEDDLQLAAALKGPLLGLDEQELFDLAQPRAGSLWWALLAHRGAETPTGRAAEVLARLANRADMVPPHQLLAEVLGDTGPGFEGSGRARILARLGPDAAEPLDELLNAALTYERAHPPSLQGFVTGCAAAGRR
jgi:ATP-dependent helicase/nuclease subunit A